MNIKDSPQRHPSQAQKCSNFSEPTNSRRTGPLKAEFFRVKTRANAARSLRRACREREIDTWSETPRLASVGATSLACSSRGDTVSDEQGDTEEQAPRLKPAAKGQDDLVSLAGALLQPSAKNRIRGSNVAARVGADADHTSADRDDVFIGRRDQLRVLHATLESTRRNRPAVVVIYGESGVGKSALAQKFLEQAQQRVGALAFATRCHQAERLPYRSIDGLVDAAARHLSETRANSVSRPYKELCAVFPVLRRFADGDPEAGLPRDDHELRRRAFVGLRALFRSLGDARPLVLHVDDLQWGDTSDARLLRDIVTREGGMSAMLLVCCRKAVDASDPVVDYLLETPPEVADLVEIDLGRLGAAESFELAQQLGSGRTPAIQARVGSAEGLPFLVQRVAESERRGEKTNLEGILRADIEGLDEEARELLELVSVAGQPASSRVLQSALGENPSSMRASVHQLRAMRLLRDVAAGSVELETYHDRIRETVLDGLSAAPLRARHEQLAKAFEHVEPEPERLARHWRGAGHSENAAVWAEHSGDFAAKRRQARRAVEWYERAVELGVPEDRRAALLKKLGDALAQCGENARAAETFGLAASRTPDDRLQFELLRLAGMNYLLSGLPTEGTEAMQAALSVLNLRLPGRGWTVWLRTVLLVSTRLLLGTKFRWREEADVPWVELARVDAWDAVAVGYAISDPLTSSYGVARKIELALATGEPTRVHEALGDFGVILSLPGGQYNGTVQRLFEEADAISERTADPRQRAAIENGRGVAGVASFDWAASERTLRNIPALRATSRNLRYDMSTTFPCIALGKWMLGDLRDLSEVSLEHDEHSGDTGDLRGQALASVFLAIHDLTQHRPDHARERLDQLPERWWSDVYCIEDAMGLVGRAYLSLCEGGAATSWAQMREAWPALEKSMILELAILGFLTWHARGLVAVACAPNDPKALGDAKRAARKLRRGRRPANRGAAASIEACVLAVRGRSGVDDRLQEAAREFDAAEMPLHALCARRVLASRSEQPLEPIDQAICEHGIANPSRWTAMLFPMPAPRQPSA